jgi:hypothetical protein
MKIKQIRAIWFWAAVGVLLAVLWQTTTVYANFGGNWTALFCTGDTKPVPPILASGTYIFKGSTGYDGQWYRYMAHDPLLRGDMHAYLDAPLLRYRRILVPWLASLLAFGQQDLIDGMYVVVILGFIFAGCYWCGVWADRRKRHPAWGLLFLLVPATLISIDRMTIDIAAAALAAGAVVYWDTGRLVRCHLCLAAGCLVRETGTLIVAGWVVAFLLQKRWRTGMVFATAIVPAMAWTAYLQFTLPRTSAAEVVPRWLFHWDSGIVGRLIDPVHYGFSQPLEAIVRSLDVLSLAGMMVAFAVVGIAVVQFRTYPATVAAGFHLALFAIVNLKGFWDNVYGYGRPFSPMIVLAAMSAPLTRKLRVSLFVAAALMDLRILLQLAPQGIGILKILAQ